MDNRGNSWVDIRTVQQGNKENTNTTTNNDNKEHAKQTTHNFLTTQ